MNVYAQQTNMVIIIHMCVYYVDMRCSFFSFFCLFYILYYIFLLLWRLTLKIPVSTHMKEKILIFGHEDYFYWCLSYFSLFLLSLYLLLRVFFAVIVGFWKSSVSFLHTRYHSSYLATSYFRCKCTVKPWKLRNLDTIFIVHVRNISCGFRCA